MQLTSVKETPETDNGATPDMTPKEGEIALMEDDDKDSIDSEIMKDLQAYRKEKEIEKLKDVNSDDSLSESHSRNSEPTSPTKVQDEFQFVEERAEIFSQDSLRKIMREIKQSPKKDIDKGLGPTLTIRGDSKKNVLKGASSRNFLNEKVMKKNKKKLKLKINNIIVDIDKSIYEINKNNDNKVFLR